MIKYTLRCDQDHEFEGWFRNSEDCEAQTRDGQLHCPLCGSTSIAKSLMTPRVSGTRSQNTDLAPADNTSPEGSRQSVATGAADQNQAKLQEMLRAVRDHVVENSDYVGDKFAEEARKMHFKETESRGIYGEATSDEVESLAEDGIDCLPLPRLPKDQN